MNQILVVAISEINNTLRERVFFLLLSVFLLMTIASSFIGWATYSTTSSVYQTSVIYLHQHGIYQIPSNPVLNFPALAGFRNVIVYMFLIGSLMAIVIGNRSFIRERKSGALQLIFTRPISITSIILGKIIGVSVVLFVIVSLTAIVSIVSSFLLPLQQLGGDEVLRLLAFYLYSFFYILLFAFLGLLFAITAKSESLSLFIPVCIWVGVSFVIPELITGQTPTALLNPVTIDTVSPQSYFFVLMQQMLAPISIGWHYTSLGSQLLNSSADSNTAFDILLNNKNSITVLFISLVSLYLIILFQLQKFNVINDVVSE